MEMIDVACLDLFLDVVVAIGHHIDVLLIPWLWLVEL
jgi:hypothetical protein